MKQKSSRGVATRAKIISAAADLISKKGFNGTSVDDILFASATGKSQFYHYFSSKNQLAHELIDFLAQSMPLLYFFQNTTIVNLSDFEKALDDFAQSHSDGRYPQGCLISNLATELVSSDEEIAAHFQRVFGELNRKMSDLVTRLQYRGQIRSQIDANRVACFIVSSLQGGLSLAKILGNSEPLGSVITNLKDFLIGMRKDAVTTSGVSRAARPMVMTYCP